MKKKIMCLLLALFMLTAAGCAAVSTSDDDTAEASRTEGYQQEEVPQSSAADLSFETLDIDGNKVTSQEVFGAHKVTMLNIWTSWCGYCIMEMPELEQMDKEFAQNDCAIVGLLLDAYEDTGLEDGKAAVKDTGVTYTVLLPWDGCEIDLPVQAFPTTVFIDSEGRFIDVDPVIGADIEGYKKAMEEALAKVG